MRTRGAVVVLAVAGALAAAGLAWILLAPGTPEHAPQPEAQPRAAPAPVPAAAWERLRGFADLLHQKKEDTDVLVAALEAVARDYRAAKTDEGSGQVPTPAPDKDRADYLEGAEDAFLRAYRLRKVRASTKTNEREHLNARAAVALGSARPQVTGRLIAAFEALVKDAKDYDPATALYDETFKAIARLDDHEVGLPYVIEWIKYDNTGAAPDRIKAAFEALVLFEDVPGRARFEIVDRLQRTFAGVEANAALARDAKERAQKSVWDKVGPSVIAALRHYTGSPVGPDGTPLTTVKAFQAWLREHRYSPKRVPWVAPK